MKYRWIPAPPQPERCTRLVEALGLSPLFAQCLVNRGLTDPESASRFLEPRLKNLSDPGLLPNMAAAVGRLIQARALGETVVIFGDYDVDGVTSTTILFEVLQALGWRVFSYLPHRLTEGYGLSRDGVENCVTKLSPNLLLAVDCGSTSRESVAWLKEQGIDVVVLDHHQVSEPPPAAVAVVNPQLSPPGTPSFRELCSAGLSFKLAHALVKAGRAEGWPAAQAFDVRPFLDLVALGTIADLVPMVGENRILVAIGLERLNNTSRVGLQALKTVAQIQGPIGPYEVGFQLAPRLNAAGRLETAQEALELLLNRNPAKTQALAESLDAHNRERQAIERAMVEEAITRVKARFNPATDYVIVEEDPLWHVGVVGIVASRVVQEFHRPAIIIGCEGSDWRGSGRSIEGFDLARALDGCHDLLLRHGGHAMAAGLSLEAGQVQDLRLRLNELARQALTPEQLQPRLRLDAEVLLREVTLERVEELERLRPTGIQNPQVQLACRKVFHQRPPVRMGREQQHAKLWISDGQQVVEMVWWNCGPTELPKVAFDVAFVPQINEWNDRRQVQLKLLDWSPCQGA